jgi:hypothetical protein
MVKARCWWLKRGELDEGKRRIIEEEAVLGTKEE